MCVYTHKTETFPNTDGSVKIQSKEKKIATYSFFFYSHIVLLYMFNYKKKKKMNYVISNCTTG